MRARACACVRVRARACACVHARARACACVRVSACVRLPTEGDSVAEDGAGIDGATVPAPIAKLVLALADGFLRADLHRIHDVDVTVTDLALSLHETLHRVAVVVSRHLVRRQHCQRSAVEGRGLDSGGRADGRTDRRVDRRVDRRTARRVDRRVDRRADRRADRRVDRRVNRWVSGLDK